MRGSNELVAKLTSTAVTMPMDDARALVVITRIVKAWMELRKNARKSFLDQKAMQAGAAECIWYTTENLMARERLKADRRVVASLRAAWERLVPPGAEQIGREEYVAMTRVLYLALKLQAWEADFDPDDCMESLDEDWAEDAAGKDYLDYEDFARCGARTRIPP